METINGPNAISPVRHYAVRLLIASLLTGAMLGQGDTSQAAHTEFTGCSTSVSPIAATPSVATPVAVEPTLDEAFVSVYGHFAQQSIDAVALGTEHFERSDVLAFAQQQQENAVADVETLASLPISAGTSTYVSMVNMIETGKMQLDLPAGIGGEESFGIGSGLAGLCTLEGPGDDLYLALAADLTRQKIELAQVASVFASDPAVIEFAIMVIERETTTAGVIVTLLEPQGTPAASAATD